MLERFTSVLGLFAFVGIAWLISTRRSAFPWRTVLWGIGLQFAFAILIMYTGPGKALFIAGQDLVRHLNDFASEGASLVFGPLASPDSLGKAFGPANRIVFAVSISATVILVSALSSLLYHWGILQQVVRAIATVMMKAMGTSGSESLAAASNIFLGQTEAALVIKPYIARMTRSEVMALMTTGMATIATGVMVVYGTMDGIDAGHILTASVLSAPAGLLIAKIMVPETEQSETGTLHHFGTERTTVNAIDALCQGASEGVSLSINIMGMLIAFVATVALANALLAWPQTLLHVDHPITFQQIAGWLNAPFAWLIGIPAKDCGFIGQVLGQRIVLNEFIGYLALSEHVKTNPGSLDPRSITLASYALCGFANFTSIAIQIGGISALAPSRRVHLAELGFRSMIGGLLACYLTATVIGVIL